MTHPKPRAQIMDIKPYKGGASRAHGVAQVLKLSSNENPLGASPLVQTAVAHAMRDIHLYPSSDHQELREAIALHHALQADQIICGAGSDEIISLLCQAFCTENSEVIHTEHGFSMYRICAQAAGATPVEVPEKDRVVDVDAILAACTLRTKLVFIANPANPTGTMLTATQVNRLAQGLPKEVVLVLDGAYAEYVGGFDGGADLVHQYQNVVMTRTFSKLYGLGGMRVGWGYASPFIIDILNRVRGPFNLSRPALAAAIAALKDTAFAQKSVTENAKWRDWLTAQLTALGLRCDPSFANFILVRFETPAMAAACNDHLRAAGILVRPVQSYKLPECLRITIADEAGCRQVAHSIKTFIEGAR